MTKTTIRAVCKQWSEWSTDEEGELVYLLHDFEGAEVEYYNVFDENMDIIAEEIETFEEAREIANNHTN